MLAKNYFDYKMNFFFKFHSYRKQYKKNQIKMFFLFSSPSDDGHDDPK